MKQKYFVFLGRKNMILKKNNICFLKKEKTGVWKWNELKYFKENFFFSFDFAVKFLKNQIKFLPENLNE